MFSILPSWMPRPCHRPMWDSFNSKRISDWDSRRADELLRILTRKHGYKRTPACKEFINKYLFDKIIVSVVGDVAITAKSRGKLVDKIRPNKALAVARIPEILMQGEVILIEDLTKIRNDDFVKFYTLQRRLRFDLPAQSRPLVLLATLKVAELGSTDKQAYYLTAAKEKTHFGVEPYSESTSHGDGHHHGQQRADTTSGFRSHITAQHDQVVKTAKKTNGLDSFHTSQIASRKHLRYSKANSQSRWLDDIQPQFDRVGNGAWVQKIVLLDTLEVR